MNDTSKKFDHFRLSVYTHAGDTHASVSFNLEATDKQGRIRIQDLTYKDTKKLCAVIGNFMIETLKPS